MLTLRELLILLTVMMAVFNSRHYQFPAGELGDEEGEYIRLSLSRMLMGS